MVVTILFEETLPWTARNRTEANGYHFWKITPERAYLSVESSNFCSRSWEKIPSSPAQALAIEE